MKYKVSMRIVSEHEKLFDATLDISDYLRSKKINANYIHMTRFDGSPIETTFTMRDVPKRKMKHIRACVEKFEHYVGKRPGVYYEPIS